LSVIPDVRPGSGIFGLIPSGTQCSNRLQINPGGFEVILQCDQCQTRFRLDDSKLKPGGVKVRCSKCRHVFVAGADVKPEESEFDALLSGLGAPAPEKQEPAPQPPHPPEPAFAPTTAPTHEAAEPAPAKPVPAPEQPEAAAEPEIAASDFPDFSTFDFPTESAAAAEKPAPLPDDQDFGSFDFETEPTAQQEAQAVTASQGADYGEFSFMEEPAATERGPEAAGKEEFEFGEFPFEAEPEAAPAGKGEAAPGAGLDFGEFDFNPEPLAKAQEAPAAAAAASDLDFGEFAFEEEPVAKGEQPAAPAESFDFGEFSFDEEPPPFKETPAMEEPAALAFPKETPQTVAPVQPQPEEEFSLGNFSFEEEPIGNEPAVAAEPTFPGPLAGKAAARAEEPVAPPLDAGAAAGLAAGAAIGAAAGAAAFGAAKGAKEAKEAKGATPTSAAESKQQTESPLDFGFGGPVPTRVPGFAEEEEELPPLSISSRRKGRSLLFISAATISVLAVVALSGAGLYLLQSGPAAVEKFDKLHLGFVGKWFGMESPEEGRIVVKNPLASFVQNKEAGELFVVQGQAENTFKKSRASIRVKVSIFDKKGAVIMQKTAYCGNKLSNEQLATLPMARIDSIQNNQFGDSLSNLGVKPGQSINFVVALANVPKDAADFGVEVVGSTVAGQ
jgi:predicted Zn finger-like uncharacterized protein